MYHEDVPRGCTTRKLTFLFKLYSGHYGSVRTSVSSETIAWHHKYTQALTQRARYAVVGSPIRLPYSLSSIYQLLQLRDFVRSSGLKDSVCFPSRFQLYEFIHETLIGQNPIEYLEFGVYRGHSIRKWSTMNQNPESRFFGFETFEGLPEPWQFATGVREAGYFSTGGATPDIPDSRVRFSKGAVSGYPCRLSARFPAATPAGGSLRRGPVYFHALRSADSARNASTGHGRHLRRIRVRESRIPRIRGLHHILPANAGAGRPGGQVL